MFVQLLVLHLLLYLLSAAARCNLPDELIRDLDVTLSPKKFKESLLKWIHATDEEIVHDMFTLMIDDCHQMPFTDANHVTHLIHDDVILPGNHSAMSSLQKADEWIGTEIRRITLGTPQSRELIPFLKALNQVEGKAALLKLTLKDDIMGDILAQLESSDKLLNTKAKKALRVFMRSLEKLQTTDKYGTLWEVYYLYSTRDMASQMIREATSDGLKATLTTLSKQEQRQTFDGISFTKLLETLSNKEIPAEKEIVDELIQWIETADLKTLERAHEHILNEHLTQQNNTYYQNVKVLEEHLDKIQSNLKNGTSEETMDFPLEELISKDEQLFLSELNREYEVNMVNMLGKIHGDVLEDIENAKKTLSAMEKNVTKSDVKPLQNDRTLNVKETPPGVRVGKDVKAAQLPKVSVPLAKRLVVEEIQTLAQVESEIITSTVASTNKHSSSSSAAVSTTITAAGSSTNKPSTFDVSASTNSAPAPDLSINIPNSSTISALTTSTTRSAVVTASITSTAVAASASKPSSSVVAASITSTTAAASESKPSSSVAAVSSTSTAATAAYTTKPSSSTVAASTASTSAASTSKPSSSSAATSSTSTPTATSTNKPSSSSAATSSTNTAAAASKSKPSFSSAATSPTSTAVAAATSKPSSPAVGSSITSIAASTSKPSNSTPITTTPASSVTSKPNQSSVAPPSNSSSVSFVPGSSISSVISQVKTAALFHNFAVNSNPFIPPVSSPKNVKMAIAQVITTDRIEGALSLLNDIISGSKFQSSGLEPSATMFLTTLRAKFSELSSIKSEVELGKMRTSLRTWIAAWTNEQANVALNWYRFSAKVKNN